MKKTAWFLTAVVLFFVCYPSTFLFGAGRKAAKSQIITYKVERLEGIKQARIIWLNLPLNCPLPGTVPYDPCDLLIKEIKDIKSVKEAHFRTDYGLVIVKKRNGRWEKIISRTKKALEKYFTLNSGKAARVVKEWPNP